MRLTIIPILFCFGAAGISLAQSPSSSCDACLPPTSDSDRNPEGCILTYRPSPPLGQNIDVSECRFLPEQAAALGQVYMTMHRSLSNRSEERVAFFKYGVRYMEAGSSTPLVEVGFEGAQRFSTALMVPILQPRETRSFRLIGPTLPIGKDPSQLDISVEVLGVSVPGSRSLR